MLRPVARTRPTVLRRWAMGGVALWLGLACGSDDDGTATGESGSSGTTGEPAPRPTFAEPASGMLSLSSTRTRDLELRVVDVMPGRTELVIDGRSFGTLDEGAAAGRLEPERLTLGLRGSMIAGTHSMVLRTVDPSGLAQSDVMQVEIVGAPPMVLTASAPTPTELGARRLLAQGYGADGLLVGLDDQEPSAPRLHLLPRSDDGWDVDGRRTVAVPGLVLAADDWALPVAAQRRDREGDEAGRVRVAWRVGAPGTRIDVIDVAWDDAGSEVVPVRSLTVDDALAGRASEWAQLGRPWLLGDHLLAELWAPVDVEAPRPGDHALVWTRVQDRALGLDPVQRVSVRPDVVDLDRLGPALDRVSAEAGGPPLVTVRADQHQPLVLEPDGAGGLRVRPTVVDGRDRSFSFADLPLVTVVGAFGSRTVAGITARSSGRLRVTAIDDLGDGDVRESSLGPDDLPPLESLTAEIAGSTVGGLSVFLVPFGGQAPVQAVYDTGSMVRVAALPELHCEAIAVADPPGPDGEAPLACARDGQLHLGTLAALPVE